MLIPCNKSYEHYQRFILEIKKWRRNQIAVKIPLVAVLGKPHVSTKSEEHVSKRLSYYNQADPLISAAQLIAGNQRKDQLQSYTFFLNR